MKIDCWNILKKIIKSLVFFSFKIGRWTFDVGRSFV